MNPNPVADPSAIVLTKIAPTRFPIVGHVTTTGLVVGSGKLAGTAAGHATTTANLAAIGVLAATVSLRCSTSAQLAASGALEGAARGYATVSGTPMQQGSQGRSSGKATVSGTLTGSGTLVANASGKTSTTAQIEAIDRY